MDGITPFEVAERLRTWARETLARVDELARVKGGNQELRLTLGDYEAMAHLGHYYAEKISGACALALYDKTGQASRRKAL